MNKREKIKQEIQKLEIEISDNQCDQLLQYYELLIEWNEFMNLTTITDFDDVLTKHFIDSLELVKVIDLNQEYSLLDLGTGAGFPGIPLKIVFPNLKVTLLDSLNKRVKFLNQVIETLSIKNIYAFHGRAEDYAKDKEYREQYDLCVSRAVANLATLSEYCIPYVKKQGYFIPYKSGKIEEEVEAAKKAIHVLGGKIERIENFNLIDTNMERSFVVIKKCKETPNKYPRNAGKPTREPIK
ncbi:MAG: 16S rRNA (guanine(527)-N(7))-methyltransferase RsmG [Velocimicrobium sp.]